MIDDKVFSKFVQLCVACTKQSGFTNAHLCKFHSHEERAMGLEFNFPY